MEPTDARGYNNLGMALESLAYLGQSNDLVSLVIRHKS
jgi:hypothetical protein